MFSRWASCSLGEASPFDHHLTNMIKPVTFDGDDSLWSFDDMMRAALAQSLKLLEEWH